MLKLNIPETQLILCKNYIYYYFILYKIIFKELDVPSVECSTAKIFKELLYKQINSTD